MVPVIDVNRTVMLPSRPRPRCRNEKVSLTIDPSSATGSPGHVPSQDAWLPDAKSRPRTMTARAAAARAISRPGRRKSIHSRRRTSVKGMPRFYRGGHNTARTTAVTPLLGALGHAEGMIRLRNRTVGLRFTIMYAALFLLSGVGLLALTFLLSGGSRTTVAGPDQSPPVTGDASGAQRRIEDLQSQLDQVQVERSRQLL